MSARVRRQRTFRASDAAEKCARVGRQHTLGRAMQQRNVGVSAATSKYQERSTKARRRMGPRCRLDRPTSPCIVQDSSFQHILGGVEGTGERSKDRCVAVHALIRVLLGVILETHKHASKVDTITPAVSNLRHTPTADGRRRKNAGIDCFPRVRVEIIFACCFIPLRD